MNALIATNKLSEVTAAASAINFSQPSWDLFILLIFMIAVVLFSITLGRQRVVSILLSVYLSLTVVNALPYLDQIWSGVNTSFSFFAVKISSFVLIFIILFIILSRSSVLYEATGAARGIISTFVFSLLFVGLLTSIVLGFLPQSAIDSLTQFTKNLFISDIAKFLWLVLPILAMAVFRGRRAE